LIVANALQRAYVGFFCAACMLSSHARSDAPADQYEMTADTVTDRKTGLTWQRMVDTTAKYDLEAAKGYCEQLTLSGGGWRVPALKELLTLVDPTRVKPAIDPTAFPSTPSDLFVTASERVGGFRAGQWRVDFGSGGPASGVATLPSWVRCVR
jgi:hypothetical protein